MLNKVCNINKSVEWILKILILISIPSLTLLLSNRFPSVHIFLGILFSFLITLYFVLTKIKISKIDIYLLILSVFISLYMIMVFMNFSNYNINLIQKICHYLNINFSFNILNKIVGMLSIPGLTLIVYIFIKKIKKFILDEHKIMTTTEKKYISIVLVMAIISAFFITTLTTAFTKPIYNKEVQAYDVIYTSDTGALINGNTFFNVSYVENDIRQPLFGIMSLPFSVPAMFIGQFLFMLPNVSGYEVMLVIIQFLLIAITTIFLARMLNLKEKDKIIFYLLFSFSYPYLLFSLLLEQYVIALFWLILTIYIYYKKLNKINYSYVGAVGAMLTSGIIFPLISKFTTLKNWICDVFKCFLAFMSVTIIGGQFSQIITAREKILMLSSSFAGKITFYDKCCQFLNFIQSILLAPSGKCKISGGRPSYQLIEINSISIIGIIILVIVTLGFYLNRKNKIAQVSAFWVLFSFIILCLIGWGAPENGMILYSLYFSWAYLILIFLFFKSTFKNLKIPIIALIIVMFIYNLKELINIINFAITYY